MSRIIDWMVNLPADSEASFRKQVLEQERNMPYITTYRRAAIAEGLVQGREEGLGGRRAGCVVLAQAVWLIHKLSTGPCA